MCGALYRSSEGFSFTNRIAPMALAALNGAKTARTMVEGVQAPFLPVSGAMAKSVHDFATLWHA
jgi:hypothetical protein